MILNVHANDPYRAAQQSLPLGTKVKVTDLENNKTIEVVVTDRMGKASGENLISLSYWAMKLFDLKKSDPIKVKVENNIAPMVAHKRHDGILVTPVII